MPGTSPSQTDHTLSTLGRNIRFYILASTASISLLVISVLRLAVESDQLFYIRVEQLFGYLCILYWYIALLISPLKRVVGETTPMQLLAFGRRAIGVSAAWFALLHVFVSLWGQIGGISGLALLPTRFAWSLGLGTVALIILLLMAATSFNKVIAFMTFPRWKWLHRLGYFGGVLAMAHLWMVGTHMAYLGFKVVIFVLLTTLFRLESLRVAQNIVKNRPVLAGKESIISIGIWVVATALLLFLPQLMTNSSDHYHLGMLLGSRA